MEHNFNPMLTPSDADKGGETAIEHPARVRNIAWQTRAAPLTPAEDALAGALQSLFDEGVDDLAAVAARLNGMIPPPAGASTWSAELLRAELARLGA